MRLAYDIVDVFTDRPFAGNQLAVVHGAGDLTTEQCQAIAQEFNYSETTFPVPGGDHDYSVRIFTPGSEIPFAGHPTLGTAWVLRSRGLLAGGDATQHCGAGDIGVRFLGERGVELDGGAARLRRALRPVRGPAVRRPRPLPQRPRRPGVDLRLRADLRARAGGRRRARAGAPAVPGTVDLRGPARRDRPARRGQRLLGVGQRGRPPGARPCLRPGPLGAGGPGHRVGRRRPGHRPGGDRPAAARAAATRSARGSRWAARPRSTAGSTSTRADGPCAATWPARCRPWRAARSSSPRSIRRDVRVGKTVLRQHKRRVVSMVYGVTIT